MSLTFACELAAQPLTALFADGTVIDALRALDARVSLGLLDLGSERAEVARQLNDAGIPVVAWLLLPESEGYWLNAGNSTRAVARYAAFRAWSSAEKLSWDGVGLDIEPHIALMDLLLKGQIVKALPQLLHNLTDRQRALRAHAIYTTLVTQMRLDGYRVESYQFPFILDERRVNATVLQRLLGLVNLDVDHEVLMLYSSFLGDAGPGILWSYGQEHAAYGGGIGIGSTGAGVELTAHVPPLTWSELVRDLHLARQLTDHVFIFSLEGCARRGFLEWLVDLDLATPTAAPPPATAPVVETARGLLRGLLWTSAHPGATVGVLTGALALILTVRRLCQRASR